MKRICSLLLVLLISLSVTAQSVAPTYPIGDTLPDTKLLYLYRQAGLPGDLLSIRRKLVIIDFFATNCKGCIHALPRLDSLQSHYSSQLQIILVTYESPERLNHFFACSPIGKKIHLPAIAGDSSLQKNFPHQSLSHLVWINKGIVKAITWSDYANDSIVHAMLLERELHLPIKREVPDYDYSQPLLTINRHSLPSFSLPMKLSYAAVTSYLPSLETSINVTIDSTLQIAHYNFINCTIPELYFRVAGIYTFPHSHMALDVADQNKYIYRPAPAYQETWDSLHRYCYDALLPMSMTEEQQRRKMRRDLDDYFGVEGFIERRNTDCLVISPKQASASPKAHADPNVTKDKIFVPTLEDLVNLLNQQLFAMPVFEDADTVLNGPFYFSGLSDLGLLEKELNAYGLAIKKEKRETDMFILRENKPGVCHEP